jgi:GNAT superfamily N-acetyltransferase
MASERVKVIALPKQHQSTELWTDLALRQKEFRLLSLKSSPESFSSTYEREVAFDLQVWKDRLSNPSAETFVAIKTDEEQEGAAKDDVEEAVAREWHGALVLVNRLEEQSTVVSGSTGLITVASPKEGEQFPKPSLHYQFNAVYVLPTSRGHGIGAKLINFATAQVREHCMKEGAKRLRFTLVVNYDNVPARSLYERCGFHILRRYVYHDERFDADVEAAAMELSMDLEKL